MPERQVKIIISASDKTAKAVKGVRSRLTSLGKSMMGVGAKLTLGLTVPIVALGVKVAKMAGDFEAQMNIMAIAARSSGTSLEDLQKAAIATGADIGLVGIDAVQAADAMTSMYKAGLTTADMFGGPTGLNRYLEEGTNLTGTLRAAIDLAAASDLDLAGATDAVIVAMSTYSIGAEEATRVSDNLVAAADASVAEVSELAAAMSTAGPVMAGFGWSMEDVNTALALLSMRGIRGAEAGTALRAMMTNLLRPTKAVTETLQGLNISLFDENKQLKALPDIIGELSNAFVGLTEEQRLSYIQTLAGTYGMKAANTLMAEGVTGWNEMEKAIGEAATAQEVAAERTKGFNASMEALSGMVQTFMIVAGKPLIETILMPLVENMQKIVGWLLKLDPEWVRMGVIILGVVAAAGPLITILGALSIILPAILSPVGLVIAAVIGLTAAWVASQGGIGPAIETMRGFVERLQEFATQIAQHVDYIKMVFTYGGGIVGAFYSLLTILGLSPETAGRVTEIMTPIADAIEAGIDSIIGILRRIRTVFEGGMAGATEAFSLLFALGITPETIIRAIQITTQIGDAISNAIGKIVEFVRGVPAQFQEVTGGDPLGFLVGLIPTDILAVLKERFGPIITMLSMLATNAVKSVISIFKGEGAEAGIQEIIYQAFNIARLLPWLKEMAVRAIFDLGRTIFDTLGKAFPALKPFIDEWVKPVLTLGETFAIEFGKIKGVLLGELLAAFREAWPQIQQSLETFAGTIRRVIPQAVGLIRRISEIVRKVASIVGPIIADLIAFVLPIIADFIAFVVDNMPLILDTIDDVLTSIQIIWDAVWPYLSRVLMLVWGHIKETVQTVLNVIHGLIKTIMKALQGDWEGAWHALKETAVTLFEGLLGILENLLGGLVNIFTGKVEDFKSAGRAIIQGIIDGVKAKIGDLKNIVKSAGEGAVRGVKAFFKMGSPSQLFKEFGLDIMTGWAEGIKLGEAKVMKNVALAIQRFVDAFKMLVELQRGMRGLGVGFDITAIATQFKQTMITIVTMLNEIQAAFSYRRIKELAKTTKRLKDMLDVVLTDLSAIKLIELPDMALWRDQIVAVASAVVMALQDMKNKFRDWGLENANKTAEYARKIFDFIKPAIDTLTTLAEYKPLKDLGPTMENIKARLLEIVPVLASLASEFATLGLGAASDLYAALSGVLAIVKPGIDAIKALFEYEKAEGLLRLATDFGVDINTIAAALESVANIAKTEAMTAANTLYGALSVIFSIIKPGIDAIKDLFEYEKQTGLLQRATDFGVNINTIAAGLESVANVAQTTAMEAASALYSAMAGMLAIIKPGIDAVKELFEYEKAQGLLQSAIDFGVNVNTIAAGLESVANIAGTEAMEAAGKLYTAMSGVLAIIKPGLDAIKELFEYEKAEGLLQLAKDFGADIASIAEGLRQAANIVAIEAMEAAAKFYQAAQDVIGIVKPTIAAIVAMLAYEGGDIPAAMTLFKTDLMTMLGPDGLPSVTFAMEEGFESAKKFKAAASKITETLNAALQMFKGLTETEAGGYLYNLEEWHRTFMHWVGQVTARMQTQLGTLVSAIWTAKYQIHAAIESMRPDFEQWIAWINAVGGSNPGIVTRSPAPQFAAGGGNTYQTNYTITMQGGDDSAAAMRNYLAMVQMGTVPA